MYIVHSRLNQTETKLSRLFNYVVKRIGPVGYLQYALGAHSADAMLTIRVALSER